MCTLVDFADALIISHWCGGVIHQFSLFCQSVTPVSVLRYKMESTLIGIPGALVISLIFLMQNHPPLGDIVLSIYCTCQCTTLQNSEQSCWFFLCIGNLSLFSLIWRCPSQATDHKTQESTTIGNFFAQSTLSLDRSSHNHEITFSGINLYFNILLRYPFSLLKIILMFVNNKRCHE